MSDKTYTITEAKAQLSALIKKVMENGEDILIGHAGSPKVRLSVYRPEQDKKRLGLMEGQATLPSDWKDLPEDLSDSIKEKLGD